MDYIIFIFNIIVVFTAVQCVQIRDCKDHRDVDHDNECLINKIEVNECSPGLDRYYCSLSQVNEIFVNIEYSPRFQGPIYANIYNITLHAEAALKIPLNICESDCPQSFNEVRNDTIALFIKEIRPNTLSDLKVRLWNRRRYQCCAIFHIEFLP